MTKAELIELLNQWPDDVAIYVSSDEEGNRLRQLDGWGSLLTDDPTAWDLETTSVVGPTDNEYINELVENGVDMNNYTKVLVLYP